MLYAAVIMRTHESQSKPEKVKVSRGQFQPINSCGGLLNYLHGSGSTILIPGFDYDSHAHDSA